VLLFLLGLRFHQLKLRNIIHFATFDFSDFAFSGDHILSTLGFEWDEAIAVSE